MEARQPAGEFSVREWADRVARRSTGNSPAGHYPGRP
jgi:hypothetical protein